MTTQIHHIATLEAEKARRILDGHFANLGDHYDPEHDSGPNLLTQYDGEQLRLAMLSLCAAVQIILDDMPQNKEPSVPNPPPTSHDYRGF